MEVHGYEKWCSDSDSGGGGVRAVAAALGRQRRQRSSSGGDWYEDRGSSGTEARGDGGVGGGT